ncbi:uncharacterized protein VTP21DRAFT_4070 [Calcarisporiella thermophila]|uniref:uncharacterized protein n=1 Tax=Calcarisporiella thermophila TaxID=911321 RepID=UPI00374455E0
MPAFSINWLGQLAQVHAVLHELGYIRLLAILLFGVQVAWKLTYAFFLSPLRNIPGPFLSRVTARRSEFKALSGNGEKATQQDYEKYGDIYVYKPNVICICNPKDIRAVLSSNQFRKTDLYKIFEYLGIPNVATFTDPVLANRRRRQIHPYFNFTYLGKMESLILRHGIEAIKTRWDGLIAKNGGKPIEVNYRHDTQLATFDIIGALVFGREFNALATNNMSYINWVSGTFFYLMLRNNFPLLAVYPFSLLVRSMKKSHDELAEFSKESVAMRKELLAKGVDEKPADLLQALIDAEDPESKYRMSPIEVQTESVGMLLGGSETSSSAISWTVHFLLLHPEHLRRAVEEVRSQFAPGHTVTFNETRAHLPYLEACIYETLRYIPAGTASFPRISHSTGITIQGHYIPPGVEIAVNKWAAHIHKDFWDDPLTFNPVRFLDNDEAKRNMLSFSYGQRFCIGRNLAWVEMLPILANMLKDYDISLPEGSLFGPHNLDEHGRPKLMPTKPSVFTMPANPERDCRMIVTNRSEV